MPHYLTYTERPKSGNAKKAWDYFVSKHPGRTILEVCYSPSFDWGQHRAWLCRFAFTEIDSKIFGGDSESHMSDHVLCSELDRRSA